MIRMVEMSVLLGIRARGQESGTKKGRARRASLKTALGSTLRALSLDQIPQLRKRFDAGIDRHLEMIQPAFAVRATGRQPSPAMARLAEAAEQLQSVYALRATDTLRFRLERGCATRSPRRSVEARPGFE